MQNATEIRSSRGPLAWAAAARFQAAQGGCFFMAEGRLSVGIGNKLPIKRRLEHGFPSDP